MQMFVKECGPMGTGSNMFRSALRASDGTVYIGTYGPAPAIIWRYTKDERLEKVAEVEEYQLDCMVEAPNGKIYIGTAYSGLVYELDPKSGTVRSLGSPPIDSTPWIFTMVCTSKGEIYGAKGVGLFRLDWETGTFTVLGNVPGNHHTSGPNASEPIVRSLEERSDGLIWADTNRWIFLFDPQTHGVKLVADIGVYEKGCYAVLHGEGHSPVNDLYFVVMTRYSGMKIETPLNRLDAQTHEITPITDVEMDGRESFCGWQKVNGENVFLMSSIRDYGSELIAYSPRQQKVIHRWRNISSDHQLGYVRNSGDRLLFFAQGRSALLEAPYGDDSIIRLAENPVAAECRCLAISEQSTLGTDTYDCGYVFTTCMWRTK